MATQSSLQRLTRRALLASAKADPALLAIVAEGAIDPDGEPAWPFVLIETPRTLRLRMPCVRGATVMLDLHAFARPRFEGGGEVETGRDHIARLGSALEALFADRRHGLENGAVCRTVLSDTALIRDAAPDDWHWTAQINARVLSE